MRRKQSTPLAFVVNVTSYVSATDAREKFAPRFPYEPNVCAYPGLSSSCVFRPIVTDHFGIVTADFGIVTGHFGIVTEAVQ